MSKKCGECEDAKKIHSAPNGWSFIGCHHAPYRGKWIAEIEICPKEPTHEVKGDAKG